MLGLPEPGSAFRYRLSFHSALLLSRKPQVRTGAEPSNLLCLAVSLAVMKDITHLAPGCSNVQGAAALETSWTGAR